ncbi:MAG: hypothetical protein MIO93_15745 [ANME-2 cluster archaeon]|nr:hypothetical protein [ANME-2 cluster archaeon]
MPIVLAAMWWRRKGLAVAVFSSLVLIFSHHDLRMDAASINDFLRVLIFLTTSYVVAILSESNFKASKKAAHLYTVLSAKTSISL